MDTVKIDFTLASRIVVARLGGGGVTGDQKSKKHWQFLARNRQKFQFEVGGRERRKTNSIFCRQAGGRRGTTKRLASLGKGKKQIL